MIVLSLFDGISCGQVALERAGIPVEAYFASEIDEPTIQITQHNYPDTIQIGDVRNISYHGGCLYAGSIKIYEGAIDLVMGGSPCTQFSFAGTGVGMVTKEKKKIVTLSQYLECRDAGFEFQGQSYLFWEYARILSEVQPRYFLLENVVMKAEWESVITETLGITPLKINSSLVSAQNRVRLYWTNIPDVIPPGDRHITLMDILEETEYTGPAAVRGRNIELNKGTIIGRRLNEEGHRDDYNRNIPAIQCLEVRATNRDKSNCLTTVEKDNVLTPMPIGRHPDAFGLISGTRLPFRYYTRREYERLQTLPDGYTDRIPEAKAKKAIGNGWTVDVIAHIFSFIPKEET